MGKAVLIVFFFLPFTTEGAPVLFDSQGVLLNPCNPNIPMSYEPYQSNGPNKSEVLITVTGLFDDSILNVKSIRNFYKQGRVANMTSPDNKCSYGWNLDNPYLHAPGFPDLASFFLYRNPLCLEISEMLQEDYGKLVRVVILLNETITDEDVQGADNTVKPKLERLQTDLASLMCNFHDMEPLCGKREKDMNTTDIVEQYHVSSDAERSKRDYLFIKDLEVLLTVLNERYNNCLSLYTRRK